MREVKFIKNNADKWHIFEELLKKRKETDADELADLYIRLTDDLAWAQTFYPESKTKQYLNNLSRSVHQIIYRNRKEKSNRIRRFWKKELPLLFYKHRKMLLTSFIVFAIASLIGIISTANDPMFNRNILGDRYVNMTVTNIQNNDPLAVYKSHQSVNMFLGITFNNIKVSFIIFLSGLLASVGSGILLMKNGIMIGTFMAMFVKYHLLRTSLLIVFIHGTLELSAIIIAGAAGFVMGNGILFPGTYSRIHSFRKSAREALKMTVGLVPIFITAGFLESFVTRHTNMPVAVSLLIIGCSLTFVIWYFVYYPRQLSNRFKR